MTRAAGWISIFLFAISAFSRPNVLFIAIDDLRPALGCYGDPVALTPQIDRIAKGGTVFRNAHCQWPVCGPSRASLMTSLRPEASGVMDLKTDMRAKNAKVLSLPQHFRQLGYSTAGSGKVYDPRCVDSKLAQDAPSWSLPDARLAYDKLKFKDSKAVYLAPEVADEDLADGQIARNGIALMQKLAQGDAPFFLAVGFKKPHLPFIAPKRYWHLYTPEQFPHPPHRSGIADDSGYLLHDSPEFRGYEGAPESGPLSDELQRNSRHAYYACVSYIDAQVGLLISELERLGLADNTIIALWGDHGFHLGDHGMWGKHSTLEAATRSPLIIRPAKGKAIANTNTPVEFIDIFPTLCEFAGVPIPDALQGRSLAPVITGHSSSVRQGALTVFKKRGCIGYSHRGERYRYTEWINKFGKTAAIDLFDYSADPHETRNLANSAEHTPLIAKLAAALRAESAGCDRLHTAAK